MKGSQANGLIFGYYMIILFVMKGSQANAKQRFIYWAYRYSESPKRSEALRILLRGHREAFGLRVHV